MQLSVCDIYGVCKFTFFALFSTRIGIEILPHIIGAPATSYRNALFWFSWLMVAIAVV